MYRDPETGLLVFRAFRSIRAHYTVSCNNTTTLSYWAYLRWTCRVCRSMHTRPIPMGMPEIFKYRVTGACPSFRGSYILLSENRGRFTPDAPILTEWDALEYLARVKPELFGGERPARPAVAHWPKAPEL